MVNSVRSLGRCNSLNDLSYRICIPNKTEDLNLNNFNIITGIDDKTYIMQI